MNRLNIRTIHSLFLRPLDIQQHPIQPKHTLLQRARLLAQLRLAGGRLAPGLALDHDVEVDELLGQRRHVVLEAERVLSDRVRGEHVVALPLARAVEQDPVVWIADLEVDVELAAGLDLVLLRMSGEVRSAAYGV